MHEAIITACSIATGERTDPAATAIHVRAAKRDLNAKGNGPEWYRMVWRSGKWSYFSTNRMPAGKFLAAERRVTLYGDAYAGEILAEHPRGGEVTQMWLVTDPHPGENSDTVTLRKIDHVRQRDGLRVILPTGASITLPDPRR